VKVVFVVDKSGSMCVTDPPGVQGGGLCEQFGFEPGNRFGNIGKCSCDTAGAAVIDADAGICVCPVGDAGEIDIYQDGGPTQTWYEVELADGGSAVETPDGQTCNGFHFQPNNYCERDIGDTNPHPGRVCSLYQLISQFKGQKNVSVDLISFETQAHNIAPGATDDPDSAFVPVSDDNMNEWITQINSLQTQLGKGTDYQGALSLAYEDISQDIRKNLDPGTGHPELLPRTRYVVVFITDGTPFPRCSAIDTLPANEYATASDPAGIWPDSEGAGCPPPPLVGLADGSCYCNTAQGVYSDAGSRYYSPSSLISDFDGGQDRNQNFQLDDLITRIASLKTRFNIGDVRLHTVLLWNWDNICALGPLGADLFGEVDFAPPDGGYESTYSVEGGYTIAKWLLQRFAQEGGGIFQEFNTGGDIELGALNYTSINSPFALKSLIAVNESSVPSPTGALPDSDGDGLPDNVDNSVTGHSNEFQTDSDADCFSDLFETRYSDRGFQIDKEDPRGCGPNGGESPCIGCNSCRNPDNTANDSDHDGLSLCEEEFLGTKDYWVDSDTDGIPDSVEVRFGLDPAVHDEPLEDTDGDGNPDVIEVKAHTDPLVADNEEFAKEGYNYDIKQVAAPDGGTCYDYSISNIRLMQTDSVSGLKGDNVIRLWFDQAPQQNLTGDYGDWETACVKVRYAPPIRIPEDPEVFVPPPQDPADPNAPPSPWHDTNQPGLCLDFTVTSQ
jgi:hypothetical protein